MRCGKKAMVKILRNRRPARKDESVKDKLAEQAAAQQANRAKIAKISAARKARVGMTTTEAVLKPEGHATLRRSATPRSIRSMLVEIRQGNAVLDAQLAELRAIIG